MSTSKIRKYLLYGIGEIALVVIGILIALQINNWNQNRQDRNKEAQIVKSIFIEIGNNLNYVTNLHKRLETNRKNSIYLMNLTGPNPGNIAQDSLIQYLSIATFPWYFIPRISKLEFVLTSDDINLFQSDTLKLLLLDYKVLLDYCERVSLAFQDYYSQYIRNYNINQIGGSNLSLFNLQDYSDNLVNHPENKKREISSNESFFEGLKQSNFSFDANELLSDKQFEAILGHNLSLLYYYQLRLVQIEEHIGGMTNFIENNYKL